MPALELDSLTVDLLAVDDSQVPPCSLLSEESDEQSNSAVSLTVAGSARVSKIAAKIMIIDDEAVNIKVTRKYLQGFGYEDFITTTESARALEIISQEQPDVVLTDVVMPGVGGIEILRKMRDDPKLAHIPVIILTASCDRKTKLQVLELGATDFLAKPVDPSELIPRVRNALTAKAYHDHLANYAEELERQVQSRTAELEASRQEVIHCLARAAEFRDDDTGHHILRVGRYAGIIADELGMDEHEVELIEQAAQLHDVGKIGIADSILLKPGKLDSEEFELMQKHAGFGKRIIERMPAGESQILRKHGEIGADILHVASSPILQLASKIALTHHEKWNGSGYPIGLAGEDIPLEGRITAIADVFDALSSKRPYKPPFPLEKCFRILEEGRGQHFDPRMLDAFLARRDEVVSVQIQYADVS